MTQYDDTNRGTMGRNKRREKDTHPEFTGKLNVDGVEYWLSAWVKQSRDGERFFSLSVKPKEQRDGREPDRRPQNVRDAANRYADGLGDERRSLRDDLGEDIPF